MQMSKEQKEKYAAAGLCLCPFVCWVEPTPPHTLSEDNFGSQGLRVFLS